MTVTPERKEAERISAIAKRMGAELKAERTPAAVIAVAVPAGEDLIAVVLDVRGPTGQLEAAIFEASKFVRQLAAPDYEPGES